MRKFACAEQLRVEGKVFFLGGDLQGCEHPISFRICTLADKVIRSDFDIRGTLVGHVPVE